MNKTIGTLTIGFALLFLSGFKSPETKTLKVEISNIEIQASTQVWVSVFKVDDFLKKSIKTKSIAATEKKVSVEFDLPSGEYAVSTYHDLNNNNELDRYFIGKPKEPYGFSNNVRTLGPPSFEKCMFTLDNSGRIISIELNN